MVLVLITTGSTAGLVQITGMTAVPTFLKTLIAELVKLKPASASCTTTSELLGLASTVPELGLDNCMVSFKLPVTSGSYSSGSEMAFNVSPAAKVNVPETGV